MGVLTEPPRLLTSRHGVAEGDVESSRSCCNVPWVRPGWKVPRWYLRPIPKGRMSDRNAFASRSDGPRTSACPGSRWWSRHETGRWPVVLEFIGRTPDVLGDAGLRRHSTVGPLANLGGPGLEKRAGRRRRGPAGPRARDAGVHTASGAVDVRWRDGWRTRPRARAASWRCCLARPRAPARSPATSRHRPAEGARRGRHRFDGGGLRALGLVGRPGCA